MVCDRDNGIVEGPHPLTLAIEANACGASRHGSHALHHRQALDALSPFLAGLEPVGVFS